eukprot:COSAG05_NODE_22668_length_263_cov_0.634146_1_plen_52_part_10
MVGHHRGDVQVRGALAPPPTTTWFGVGSVRLPYATRILAPLNRQKRPAQLTN